MSEKSLDHCPYVQYPLRMWSSARPKLITLIRHKSLFYKEGQANLRIGSCLQFKWHLEQVQGTLL
jgi:hypothetical protein